MASVKDCMRSAKPSEFLVSPYLCVSITEICCEILSLIEAVVPTVYAVFYLKVPEESLYSKNARVSYKNEDRLLIRLREFVEQIELDAGNDSEVVILRGSVDSYFDSPIDNNYFVYLYPLLLEGFGALGSLLVISKLKPTEINDYHHAFRSLVKHAALLVNASQLDLSVRHAMVEKERFLRLIRQDLKKPFSSMLGFSSIMQDSSQLAHEQLQPIIQRLNGSAYTAYKLLNNVLLWTKFQLGELKLNFRWMNLSDIASQVEQDCAQQLSAKNISIQWNNLDQCMIYADWRCTSCVLSNVIENAIKYSYPGHSIYVTAESDQGSTKLLIADTGLGMKEALQQRVFNLQSEDCVEGTEGERGPGLGLMVSQDLMRWHGGSIKVTSQWQKGTTVELLFPMPQETATC